MARLVTPHFGPHAGKLCRKLDDGTLQPLPELPAEFEAALPVAVGGVPSESEARYRRGLEGAAKQIFETEHKGRSDGRSYEQVKSRVVEGRRISARKRGD